MIFSKITHLSRIRKQAMPMKPYSGDPSKQKLSVLGTGGAPLTETSSLKLRALARKMNYPLSKDFILERTGSIGGKLVTGAPSSGFFGGIAALGPIEAAHEIGHAKIRSGLSKLFNTTPSAVDSAIHSIKNKKVIGKFVTAADELGASVSGAYGIKKTYGFKTMLSALPTYTRGLLSHIGLSQGPTVAQSLQPYSKVPSVKKYLKTLAKAAK